MDNNSRLAHRAKWILFFMGLGSTTRIYFFGCLSFSEIILFAVAPYIFVNDLRLLKKDGFVPLVSLHWLACMSMACISFLYYHVPWIFILKAIAVYYSIFSYLVAFHRYLRQNMRGLGWFIVGATISSFITIFYFNPKAQVSALGSQSLGMTGIDAVVGGQLFWVEKIMTLMMLPVQVSYYQTPIWYVITIPVVVAFIAAVTSMSGRSAVLMLVAMAAIVVVGRKSRRTMRGIGRHLIMFGILGLGVVFALYNLYKYAAEHGYLTEAAIAKYRNQTKSGGGMVSLLISGRIEPIVGLMGALDKPILGFGALPIDDNGYYLKALERFGGEEDVQKFMYFAAKGDGQLHRLQTHSHIVNGWVECGIIGLVYWLYILWLIYDFVRRRFHAIPQWFGYFAFAVSYNVWHILFSPIGDKRTGLALFLTTILLARAVSQGKILLPYDMEMEARKHD